MADDIAEEVHAYRNGRGWTQKQMAGVLGCALRTPEDWESGRRNPPSYIHLAMVGLDAEEVLPPLLNGEERRRHFRSLSHGVPD